MKRRTPRSRAFLPSLYCDDLLCNTALHPPTYIFMTVLVVIAERADSI